MLNVLKILFCLDHKAPRPSIATYYPLNIRIPSQCVTELSCYIKSLDEFSQIFCCYSSSWLFSRFLKVTRLSRASHVQSYDMHIPYRAILASSVVFLIHTKSSWVGWYNTHMRHTLHTLMMISKNKILHFPFFDKLLFFAVPQRANFSHSAHFLPTWIFHLFYSAVEYSYVNYGWNFFTFGRDFITICTSGKCDWIFLF